MASEKEVEPVIVGNYVEMDTEGKPKDIKSKLSNFLWHGGSVYDAWFSCASNQVGSVFFLSIYSFPCSVFVPFHVMSSNMCFYWFFLILFMMSFPHISGGSSSAYVAILIFPTGNALWDTFSTLLWLVG